MNWKKIFANHLSDTGLLSQIYKEHKNSTARKQIILLKMGKGQE
jgi:hypothetical protein